MIYLPTRLSTPWYPHPSKRALSLPNYVHVECAALAAETKEIVLFFGKQVKGSYMSVCT